MIKIDTKIKKDEKSGLYIIPGVTNCIVHVEGQHDLIERFFEMVASYELYEDKQPWSILKYKTPQIGSFSTMVAIESLIKINLIYEKAVFDTINGSDDVPRTYSTLETVKKCTETEIMFFVNFEDFPNENRHHTRGKKQLLNLFRCYSSIFPELTFYVGFDNAGRYDVTTKKKIFVSDLVGRYLHNDDSYTSYRSEAHHVALYSETPIKYTMNFNIIRFGKISETGYVSSDTTTKRTSFIM